MKKIILLIIAVIGVVLLLASCTNTKEGMIKIRLNEVTHSVFYAPQYVAINKGFFKEEGLDIELYNGGGADKVMTAVLSGQADIGFAGAEAAIYVYNEGKEDYCVVFAQLTRCDGSFLVGRNPEPDFTWSNLTGKHIIGGRKGGMPCMTLEYVLKKNGVIPGKDVLVDTTVQFDLMAGAFTGGMGDYVTLFEPTASMLEKEGKGYVLASVGKGSGETPYTTYFAKKSYIEKNPGIIQKFTNALYRGQVWVMEHTPEEIAEVIKPSFPDTDLELLTMVARRYKEVDAWKTEPYIKKEALELLYEVMTEAGELDKKPPYEEIIDNSFAEKTVKK
jgi:NitT/TauT family transport system substrate-binding protein